jgi:glycosyltransferase involved in cell wall biosynthesis
MPGCQEVIEHGLNGLLTPPGNPRMLADAIIELLDDRSASQSMAARAAMRTRERFSLDSIAAHHDKLYQELIHERASTKSVLKKFGGSAA